MCPFNPTYPKLSPLYLSLLAMFPSLILFCPSFLPPPSLSLLPLHHPERGDRDFNGLLSSLVQLLSAPEARTLLGFQSLVQREWVAAGHPFLTRLGGTGVSEKVRMFGRVLGGGSVPKEVRGSGNYIVQSMGGESGPKGPEVELSLKGDTDE